MSVYHFIFYITCITCFETLTDYYLLDCRHAVNRYLITIYYIHRSVLLFAIRPSRDNLVALASPPWSAVKDCEASVGWRFFLAQLEFGFSFVLRSEVYCQCSTIWDLLVNHLRIGTCYFRSISFSAQLSGFFWWIIFGLGPVIFDGTWGATKDIHGSKFITYKCH